MKSRAEQLDEMSKAVLIAENRIRYYKQQDKMLQSEIKRLTRNERTHRLCTRGGHPHGAHRDRGRAHRQSAGADSPGRDHGL